MTPPTSCPHGLYSVGSCSDCSVNGDIALRPQPSGFLATLTDEQRIAALSHTGGDTHPQPSGETRESVDADIVEKLAHYLSPMDFQNFRRSSRNQHAANKAKTHYRKLARRILKFRPIAEALIRPAPVASGGQHSSATDFPPDDVLACVPVAETAGEAVAWIDPADLAQVDEGLATETVLFPREHASATVPLYAAPVPAQDDDKLRKEAAIIIRDRLRQIWEGDTHLVYSGNPPEPSHEEEGPLAKLANEAVEALNSIFPVPECLAAVKAEGK